jgi:hypothetical protein
MKLEFIPEFIPQMMNKRAVTRRSRQNKNPGVNSTVTVVDTRQKLERRLAQRSDKISIAGKCIITTGAAGGAGVLETPFTPSAFGVKLPALAAFYTRWRILSLNMYFSYPTSTVVGAIGVIDDDNIDSINPTTLQGVYELRCSMFVNPLTGSTVPLMWKPLDPDRWYYTSTQSSVNDIRDIVPGTLALYVSTSGGPFLVEAFYTIELSGSV